MSCTLSFMCMAPVKVLICHWSVSSLTTFQSGLCKSYSSTSQKDLMDPVLFATRSKFPRLELNTIHNPFKADFTSRYFPQTHTLGILQSTCHCPSTSFCTSSSALCMFSSVGECFIFSLTPFFHLKFNLPFMTWPRCLHFLLYLHSIQLEHIAHLLVVISDKNVTWILLAEENSCLVTITGCEGLKIKCSRSTKERVLTFVGGGIVKIK